MENTIRRVGVVQRVVFLAVGLFLWAIGVSLSVRSGLGVSPLVSVPYVVSQSVEIGLGMLMFVLQAVALLVEMFVLRWRFHKSMLWQMLASVAFGVMVDLAMLLTEGMETQSYAGSWLCCLGSIVVTALGISLYAKSEVAMTAVDGLKSSLSRQTGDGYGVVSVFCEAFIIILAIVVSYFWYGTILGIREGTIASVIFIPILVHLISRYAENLYAKIGLGQESVTSHTTASLDVSEEDGGIQKEDDVAPLVVTITRQFGCDAHDVGKLLAMRIGIPLYDEQLIDSVAERSGLETVEVRQNEQRLPNMFLHRLDVVNNSCISEQQDMQRKIYDATKVVMEDISKAPCVIIGRLGRHFLGDKEGCTHVFLYAPKDYGVKNLAQEEELSETVALQRIEKEDNDREKHFKYFTGMDMTDALNYDICIDTSLYGVEGAADLIASAIRQMRQR